MSIVLLAYMLIFWGAQFYTGWVSNNEDLQEEHYPPLSAWEYAHSGHFLQATFENWESEFLQMAIYVVFTVFLRQKGSAESRKLKGEEGEAEEQEEDIIVVKSDSPWPVRKGGIWLSLYKYSLSITLSCLFLLSFALHFFGSLRNTNEEHARKGKPMVMACEYIHDAKFWFESFQNWQSEFLAVAAIVLLTVFLRHHRSPESKPVSTPDSETGR